MSYVLQQKHQTYIKYDINRLANVWGYLTLVQDICFDARTEHSGICKTFNSTKNGDIFVWFDEVVDIGQSQKHKISNVPSFLLANFVHLEKQCPQPLNLYHQSGTCLIQELGLHFKLFELVEFSKIIFLAIGSKNNLWRKFNSLKKFKKLSPLKSSRCCSCETH